MVREFKEGNLKTEKMGKRTSEVTKPERTMKRIRTVKLFADDRVLENKLEGDEKQ